MTKNFVSFLSVPAAFAVYGGTIGADTPGADLGGGFRPGAAAQGGAGARAVVPAREALAAAVVDPRIERSLQSHPNANVSEESKRKITYILHELDRAAGVRLPVNSGLLSELFGLAAKSGDRLAALGNVVTSVSAFIGDKPDKPEIMENIIGKLRGTSVVGWNNLARLLTGEAREESGEAREEYRASSMGQYSTEWIAALAKASDSPRLGEIANRFYEFVSNCVSERVEMTPLEMSKCLLGITDLGAGNSSKILIVAASFSIPPLSAIYILERNQSISTENLVNVFDTIKRSFDRCIPADVVSLLLYIPGSLWEDLAAYLREHGASFKNMSGLDFSNRLRGKNIRTREQLKRVLEELRGNTSLALSTGVVPAPVAQP